MKAGEQLSTFVVPTSLACVARGGYFRESRYAGFSQGAKHRGKIDLYPLFSRRSREKEDNTAIARKFRQLRRLQRFLLKGRDCASAVL